MYLLVGLGNIGKTYEYTRHNCGFMLVDAITNYYGVNNQQTKFSANICQTDINGHKAILAKPTTLMNRSGIAVSQLKTFFKIPLENIIVFHDDLDLDFCRVKVKQGGGAGGHNGLKSIDSMVGKNYWRVRIGIGRPEIKNDVINYVLHKFNSSELKQLDDLNCRIASIADMLFMQDKNHFLNKLNVLK